MHQSVGWSPLTFPGTGNLTLALPLTPVRPRSGDPPDHDRRDVSQSQRSEGSVTEKLHDSSFSGTCLPEESVAPLVLGRIFHPYALTSLLSPCVFFFIFLRERHDFPRPGVQHPNVVAPTRPWTCVIGETLSRLRLVRGKRAIAEFCARV